jgi:hypothetical protein
MNARGDFVGRGQPTAGLERAFIYTDEGGLKDFSTLIDPALNLRVMYAHDINDAGQIAALAYQYVLGQWRAVRLNPTVTGPLAALSVTTVKMQSGTTSTGWITLSYPAPAGGALVTLASSEPGVVSVPVSVTIAAGERHQSFNVLAAAGKSGAVQLSASYGGSMRHTSLDVTPAVPSGVRQSAPSLRIHAVTPNPASSLTNLEYQIGRADRVRVTVYDVAGRLVRVLSNSPQAAGLHHVTWDGTADSGLAVPSGTYFMRIQAGGFQNSAKVVFVR